MAVKTYTLTIIFDTDKEEVDYVHEELSNDSVSEGAIEHVGTIDLSEYFDDDLVELFRHGVVMGET